MSLRSYAAEGNVTRLRAELSKGAKIESVNKRGPTALMVAAASPKAGVDILQILLDQGANVNAVAASDRDHDTDSVLGIAASNANLEKLKRLVEAGADVGYIDKHGYSILVHVMHRKVIETADEHLAVLDHLIASGAPLDAVSRYGEPVLSVSSFGRDFTKVLFFVK